MSLPFLYKSTMNVWSFGAAHWVALVDSELAVVILVGFENIEIGVFGYAVNPSFGGDMAVTFTGVIIAPAVALAMLYPPKPERIPIANAPINPQNGIGGQGGWFPIT